MTTTTVQCPEGTKGDCGDCVSESCHVCHGWGTFDIENVVDGARCAVCQGTGFLSAQLEGIAEARDRTVWDRA